MTKEKILAIGYTTRYFACSAKRAGYTVYSMDSICSLDLKNSVDRLYRLRWNDNMKEKNLMKQIDDFNVDFDAVLLGSGLEHVKLPYNTLNNEHKLMKYVSDKAWLNKKLDKLGVLHPKTHSKYTGDMDFPIVVKPRYGAGGFGTYLSSGTTIYLASDESYLPDKKSEKFILQDYIKGSHVSVSAISTEKKVSVIGINEEMIGSANSHFSYVGNITPLKTSPDVMDRIKDISENLLSDLGLIGSNGIDFVISDKDEIFVIEVNPRLQASLDTIELSTGINVFDAHLKALNGEPVEAIKNRKFAGKKILFAEKDFELINDPRKCGYTIADIPHVGKKFNKGDMVLTILETSGERGKLLKNLNEKYSSLRNFMYN